MSKTISVLMKASLGKDEKAPVRIAINKTYAFTFSKTGDIKLYVSPSGKDGTWKELEYTKLDGSVAPYGQVFSIVNTSSGYCVSNYAAVIKNDTDLTITLCKGQVFGQANKEQVIPDLRKGETATIDYGNKNCIFIDVKGPGRWSANLCLSVPVVPGYYAGKVFLIQTYGTNLFQLLGNA